MDLIRWEPRENLMRGFFDDFFDAMSRPDSNKRRRWEEGGIWAPATDLIDKKDKLIARVELPGVEKKDVKISLNENNLTIQGEIEKDKETKKDDKEELSGNIQEEINKKQLEFDIWKRDILSVLDNK